MAKLVIKYQDGYGIDDRAWEQLCTLLRETPEASHWIVDGIDSYQDRVYRYIASPNLFFAQKRHAYISFGMDAVVFNGSSSDVVLGEGLSQDGEIDLAILFGVLQQASGMPGINLPIFEGSNIISGIEVTQARESRYAESQRWPDLSAYNLRMQFWQNSTGDNVAVIYGDGLQDPGLRGRIVERLNGTWLESHQAIGFASGFSTEDLKLALPYARVGAVPLAAVTRLFRGEVLPTLFQPNPHALRPIIKTRLLNEADRSVQLAIKPRVLDLDHPDRMMGFAGFSNLQKFSPLSDLQRFDLQEAVEAAMSDIGRVLGERLRLEDDVDDLYRVAVAAYLAMPVEKMRTGTSVNLQQFSTPLPLAIAGQRASGMEYSSHVFEPTIGNGLLVSLANPEYVEGIELDPKRYATARRRFPNVIYGDAITMQSIAQSADVVIANPPFGAMDAIRTYRDAESKAEIPLKRQDRFIALNALENLRDKGGATVILGADNYLQKAGEMDDGYRSFMRYLHDHYTVIGHVAIDGSLYARHGATYPVRMIVIADRQPSALAIPDTLRVLSSWDDVIEFGEDMRRIQTNLHFDVELQKTYFADRPRGMQVITAPAISEADMEGAQVDAPSGDFVDLDSTEIDVNILDGLIQDEENPVVSVEAPEVVTEPRRDDEQNEIVIDETQGAVSYGNPGSRMANLNTIMPQNLAQPVFDAIDRISSDVGGDIDAFVARELRWSKEDLGRYLSAEQIDGIALAIHNIKKGKGFIIGDQTGIGKGRQVAAMLRWSALNGHTPVFITEKANLFMDMVRDLSDIGSSNVLRPFILNDGEKIKDPETGVVLMESASKAELEKAFSSMAIPNDYDAVFLTYSQINQSSSKSRKTAWVQQIMRSSGGVLILDESHNAGGDSQTGQNLREILNYAQGVVYSSATYAKFPDNMGIYSRTDLFDGSSVPEVIDALKAGGRVVQEIMSTMLAASGQYIRRQHAIPMTVRFDSLTETESRDRQIAHDLSSVYRRMMLLQNAAADIAKERTKEMRKDFTVIVNETDDKKVKHLKAFEIVRAMRKNKDDPTVVMKGIGCESANFTSEMWRLNSQFLLSLNCEATASRAVDSLERGEKPIIVVENTMESFIVQEVENVREQTGDYVSAVEDLVMQMDFRDVLIGKLRKFGVVTERMPYGQAEKIQLFDMAEQRGHYKAWREATSPADRRAIAELLHPLATDIIELEEHIRAIFPAGMPASPIDWVRYRIREAGFAVGEITARKMTIEYAGDGVGAFSKRPSAEISNRNETIRRFNFDGRDNLDALIINASGSTGASLHASVRFTDQRPRHMFMLQSNLNVNIVMQTLGRTLRTGLVEGAKPLYTFCNSSIPLERRPMAILRSKMASLSANTSSDQTTALDEATSDMMNKFGDRAALMVLRSNPALAHVLGYDIESEEDKLKPGGGSDLMRRMTGRLGMLPVFALPELGITQDRVYDLLEESFEALIHKELQSGRNPLASQFIDLKAIEKSRGTLIPDRGEGIFQRGVDVVELEYSKEVRAQTWNDVQHVLEMGTLRMVDDFPGCKPLQGLKTAFDRNMVMSAIQEVNEIYVRAQRDVAGSNAKEELIERCQGVQAYLESMGPHAARSLLTIGGLYRDVTLPGSEEVDDVILGSVSKGRGKSSLSWSLTFYPVKPENNGFSLTLFELLERAQIINQSLDKTMFPSLTDSRRMVLPPERSGWKDVAHSDFLSNLFDNEGKMIEVRKRVTLLDGNLLEAVKTSKEIKMGTPVIFTKADGLRYRGVMMPQHATLNKVKENMVHRFHDVESVMNFAKYLLEKEIEAGHTMRNKHSLLTIRVNGMNDISLKLVGHHLVDKPVVQAAIVCPGVKKNFGPLFTNAQLNAIGDGVGFVGDRKRMKLELSDEDEIRQALVILYKSFSMRFDVPEKQATWYMNDCKARYGKLPEIEVMPKERVAGSVDLGALANEKEPCRKDVVLGMSL